MCGACRSHVGGLCIWSNKPTAPGGAVARRALDDGTQTTRLHWGYRINLALHRGRIEAGSMSVKVQGLCYDVVFGCPKRKAIAVAVADHADHDGGSVFPSIARIAAKVEWSERTVQRTLRELEAIGLLIVVNEGGAGPKDTREWRFDMQLLADLAAGHAKIVINKGDSESPLEGDSLTPLAVVRVTESALRVTGSTLKGDSPDTRTVNNHQLEPSSRERAPATETAALARENSAPRLIRSSDREWRRWIAWHEDRRQYKAADAFRQEGAMVVFGREPSETTKPPALPPPEGSEAWQRLVGAIRNPAGDQ